MSFVVSERLVRLIIRLITIAGIACTMMHFPDPMPQWNVCTWFGGACSVCKASIRVYVTEPKEGERTQMAKKFVAILHVSAPTIHP